MVVLTLFMLMAHLGYAVLFYATLEVEKGIKVYSSTTLVFKNIYRVIRNDCRSFNNLSYTVHLR